MYLRERLELQDVETFRLAMKQMFERIREDESEEFNKNLVIEFLNKSLYRSGQYMVNTYQRTDLAIYAEMGTPDEHPVVLFEFKGPSRPDMVSRNNLKKKALYELILYYIREEAQHHNTDIKHLVITNCREFFIFEKRLFYQLFARNKRFVQQVLDADRGTDTNDYIYENIIKPVVQKVEKRLQFVYLDLQRFESIVSRPEIVHKKSFHTAYKLFSPTNLLKLPFKSDHNSLNRNFYAELLYIMGVEEVTDNGVKVIKRLKNGRQSYSLVEQTLAKLEDYGDISNDGQRFEAALGLVLTWMNRILFLKLLESQLISFNHREEMRFLDSRHIQDYDVLQDLFLKVMAKPVDERSPELQSQFPEVPYLNSSLFELSAMEQEYFAVSGIRLGEMEIFRKTVLKDDNGAKLTGRMTVLDYLFSFLDAYDFGSEKAEYESVVRTNHKSLINASVLGLIFEKINGYKDGSFFTPGYITSYICKKTLRRAIIDKFNKAKGWHCADFEELKELIDYGRRDVRTEANDIINSLRICDPAVGSGHFLVSALNELIAIKSELGVLQDRQAQPKRIRDYDVRVEYDELVIADEDGDLFRYDPSNPASQLLQETLFEEKRTIIENCLFGVDLNPKSVEICRLRLWIELLKSAYYYRPTTGQRLLQTLPNIDINIKYGNSLASAHPVCVGRRITELKGMQEIVRTYKSNVREYKNCRTKIVKNKINNDIQSIKERLAPPLQLLAFEKNDKDIERHEVMKHALEWMVEFPEVLNEDGFFEGFDAVIGNPPYISLESLKRDASVYKGMYRTDEEGHTAQRTYQTQTSRGDIYSLFVERGLQLLRKGGLLSYIMPNKWEKVIYGQPLRKLFLKQNLSHLIDFCDYQVFEDATTYTCIIRMSKEKSKGRILVSTLESINPETLSEDVEEQKEVFDVKQMDDGIWPISSLQSFLAIKTIQGQFDTLSSFVDNASYRGLLTGLSRAFNISVEKAEELQKQEYNSVDILRPFLQGRGLVAYGKAEAGSYLVFIPKGFTIKGMRINREVQAIPTEQEAWKWFSEHYRAIAEWLLPFRDEARRRTDKGDYWWELRACTYYDKFAEPKIFYQVFQTKPCFIYDEQDTFCNNSMYFITAKDLGLLAILCSKVGWWLIREFCPRIQNGAQLIWDNFGQIPVPTILPTKLAEYAHKMMLARKESYDEFQEKKISSEIDLLVYHLYGLTYDDVLIIDPETPITREEYMMHKEK